MAIADPLGSFLARLEDDYERRRRARIEPVPDDLAVDDELPGWIVWLVLIVGGFVLGFGIGTALYLYRQTH